MSGKILDGKILAQKIKDALKKEIAELKKATGQAPAVINIMIGNDAGSCAYANSQKKVAEYVGVQYKLEILPLDVTQAQVTTLIKKLNADPSVNGIMIHKPIPAQIDYRALANCVDTLKDLEGINVANIGRMIIGETKIIPCTPAAVMEHIKMTEVNIRGLEAVVVGHSEIVGKPLSLLLLEKYATVTICHVATSEAGKLKEHVARADVLVVAVGKPKLINGSWIKKGAIVIDVGINRVGDEIIGDVEFDQAKERASFITPVPGGVGPVTVVMLMRNCVEAYKLQNEKRTKVTR